jgi:2-keto-4-pentenoate hydratase
MKGVMKRLQWVVGVVVVLAGCQSIDVVQDGGFRVSQAMQQNQPAPILSPDYGKAFTVEKAYQIQRLALDQIIHTLRPLGFKAGLTSPASQQQFATTQPIAGVLLPGSAVVANEDGYQVLIKSFRKPILEAELGYRLTRRVNAPLPDVAALKAIVGEIAPVIELPDLATAGKDTPTALDLIATNVGAKRVIAGPGRAPSLTDPNAIHVDVYREGELVTTGNGRDVSGDQWQALLWLVNRTVQSGWAIEPGQLLITGSMGKSVPLQTGLYVADFGHFAHFEFSVE